MNDSLCKLFSLIKKYRFNSVFFSYFRYTLLLMIVPLVIVVTFMTQSTYSSVKSQIEEKGLHSYERSTYLLDNTIENLNNIFNQLISDAEITYLLSADTSVASPFTLRKSVSKFHSFSRNIVIGNEMFDSIFLYSKKNGYVYSTNSSNTIDDFFNLDWYEAYKKNSGSNTACPTVIDNEKAASIVMDVYHDASSVGVVVFNIKKSYLDSFFDDLSDPEFNFNAYLSSGDQRIYSYEGTLLNSEKTSQNLSYRHEISGFPLSFEIFIESDLASRTLNQMIPIIYSYFILILFSVIFIAFLCSLKFYKSIANIVASIESAYPTASSSSEIHDEINYIKNNITYILLHSIDVEKELVSHFSKLKKAQTIALQSQINPHFLFNTLNLINEIIIEDCGADTEAVRVVKELSELLNISLDTKSHTTTVDSELNYVKKYIDIELVRNDYNFSVEWDIQTEVLYAGTLKMVLQPILENAIFHGISTLDDIPGKIIVRAYEENSRLVFSVTDNGIGFDESRLYEIEEKLRSTELAESRHIGLSNVNSRIRLLYGNEYGCSLKTSPEGTTVTITQPLNYKY